MEFLTLLMIYFFVGGSFLYLLMCADPNSKGPIGFLNRLIFGRFPEIYRKYGHYLFTRKGMNLIDRFSNYICYYNHPLVQIMYLVITIGGFGLFYKYGFHEHLPNKRIGDIHYYLGIILTLIGLFFYYKTCITKPGIITDSNVKEYLKKYKTDGVMYIEDNKCTTCRFGKYEINILFTQQGLEDPSTAKFVMCVLLDSIIIAFGEKNYKYFLLFIASNAILCLYGGYIATIIFYGIVVDKNLLNMKFRMGSEVVDSNIFIVIQYLFYQYVAFFFIWVVCIIMGVTLTIFLVYHFTMISGGVTTNEKIKKGDIEYVIKREIQKANKAIESPEATEEDKKKLKEEIDTLKKDLKTLQSYFKPGFIRNLKEIFSQQ